MRHAKKFNGSNCCCIKRVKDEPHSFLSVLGYILFYENINLGSLLGFIRDNSLPVQDYDIDIVISPNDYNRILSLKSEFKRKGYSLYGKDDLLPNILFKNKPSIISFRLYNDVTHYYLEFFEGYLVNPFEV